MDNKELQEFIAWLPNNIEDFKDKTPEEVANILNDMSKTEDGMSIIEGMIATFKESVMKYGLGDKIISLVNKIKGKKEPVVKGYEANDRYYEQINDTDGSIIQNVYRNKGFDGHDLVGPEIILTRRTISPDKKDTIIYSIIDKDIKNLYKSDGTGLNNKLNGEKFNSIFDEAFKIMQDGGTFDRQEFRDNKIASGVSYRDANGNLIRNRTDKGNLGAKIAKSKAVDGFEDRSFVDEFDRSDYRARKRALKKTNPEMNRRERKAEALTVNGVNIPIVSKNFSVIPGVDKLHMPEIEIQDANSPVVRKKPKYTISVGPITGEIIDEPDGQNKQQNRRLNWNEFMYAIEQKLRNNKSYVPGMNMSALQGWAEDQYKKYTQNPDDYKVDFNTWNNDRYLNSGQKRDLTLGRPNYGYGYGDFDQDFSFLFNSEAPQVPRDNTSKNMDNIAHIITGLEFLPAAAVTRGSAGDFIDYIIHSSSNYMNSSPVRQTVYRGASSNRPVYRSSNGTFVSEYQVPRFFGLKKGGKIK